MEKLNASRFEARRRRAIDGRYWWCIWDAAFAGMEENRRREIIKFINDSQY